MENYTSVPESTTQVPSLECRFHRSSPYLFSANFGELAKEWLKAATLIQEAQAKTTQIFANATLRDTMSGAEGVAAKETPIPAEDGTGRLEVQE